MNINGRKYEQKKLYKSHFYRNQNFYNNEKNIQAVDFYKQFGFNIISRDELDNTGKHYPVLNMQF